MTRMAASIASAGITSTSARAGGSPATKMAALVTTADLGLQ